MDRPLTPGERLLLRIHLLICRMCCRYRRQLALIRLVLRGRLQMAAETGEAVAARLSSEARQRIRRAIAQHE
jgi:hypothetical protein